MIHDLYDGLSSFYDLVDPVADHADEAAAYLAALEGGGAKASGTLLELGAGAGNNAHYLKARFRCTLTDVAPRMLARSRAANPECEHVLGDMRELRLGRTFDAVFVHDALAYLLTEDDLGAAIETAAVHLEAGGVVLLAPDFVRETFEPRAELLTSEVDGRSMRGLEWVLPLEPGAGTYRVEYSFLFREREAEGGRVVAAHDSHLEGLFARATWLGLLDRAGFDARSVPAAEDGSAPEVFVGVRRR